MLTLSNIVIAMQNRLNRVFMISPETSLDDFSFSHLLPRAPSARKSSTCVTSHRHRFIAIISIFDTFSLIVTP